MLVLVGEPIEVEKTKPNLAAAKVLTDRIEAAIEELREPYGPPAHAWYPRARADFPSVNLAGNALPGRRPPAAVRCGNGNEREVDRMSPTKKRQTMGKMTRERELKERRALKQEKKDGKKAGARRGGAIEAGRKRDRGTAGRIRCSGL